MNKYGVRSLIIQKSGKMMKGKIMEEKIRTPESGSPIPVLHHFTPHHFTKYIPCEHADFVRYIFYGA
ncbi:MAG: hypothetical protein NTW21_01265 [Verrucomicrobia bacterium]|nr:hypothetical protein [Verrucomicrobiota bacterium]